MKFYFFPFQLWCKGKNSYLIVNGSTNSVPGIYSGDELTYKGLKATIERVNHAGVFEISTMGKTD